MTIRTRFIAGVCVLLAVLALGSALGTSPAGAINPAQTTEQGVVNTLNPDLDYYWKWYFQKWGRSFRSANLYYYNVNTNVANCGLVQTFQIGVACANPNSIWLALNVNQQKIDTYGDYAGGFILAHEYGHLVQFQLGRSNRSVATRELFADCLAGTFSRWEWNRGKINNNDYYEAVNLLRSFGRGSQGYPDGEMRASWFDYGFQNNNPDVCFQVL